MSLYTTSSAKKATATAEKMDRVLVKIINQINQLRFMFVIYK